MTSKTVIIKTIAGEELIATKQDSNQYEKVRVFRMMDDGQGRPQAGLVPFIMVAPDAKMVFNQDLIFCEIDCPSDVEKSYLEATSGLMLAR